MNFYHCTMPTQPDYDQLEDFGFTFEERVPKKMKRLVVKPIKATGAMLGVDTWRYHILLFCDLSTLLRLNWVNRTLRAICNQPSFVTEWQLAAWYLRPRSCPCGRNLFLLDCGMFMPFAWDCNDIRTVRHSEMALRAVGRPPASYTAALYQWRRLPHVDPPNQPACFSPGLLDTWMENVLVPMPRMLDLPVEDTHRRPPLTHLLGARHPGESPDAFRHRTFWRNYHCIPEEQHQPETDSEDETDADSVHTVIVTEEDPSAAIPSPGPPDAGFPTTPSVDLVKQYVADSEAEGRDPYDPAQDDDLCSGYIAATWARRKLFESPVGIQVYPLELCLRRSEMCGRAYRQGVDYLSQSFLPIQRRFGPIEGEEAGLLMHQGPAYFQPIRYENERGDFCNWVLSSMAILQGVYNYLWYDSCHHIIRRMDEYTRVTAAEVQADMGPNRFIKRWQTIARVGLQGQADWPVLPTDPNMQPLLTRMRTWDRRAVDLLRNPHFVTLNRLMEQWVDSAHGGALYTMHEDGRSGYLLETVVGDAFRHFAGQRSDAALMQELEDRMLVLQYVVDFSLGMGAVVDERTERQRQRTLAMYLGTATSLLMFAPGWKRTYTWEPAGTGTYAGCRVPRINLTHNHRFRAYLTFLNRRSLYYSPWAMTPDGFQVRLDEWQQPQQQTQPAARNALPSPPLAPQ